jgi:hypothetical protein
MKKRNSGLRSISTKKRMVLATLGLIIFATGVLSLMAGRLYYSNHWGVMMFAPYAILVGALVIVGMIFMRPSRPTGELHYRGSRFFFSSSRRAASAACSSKRIAAVAGLKLLAAQLWTIQTSSSPAACWNWNLAASFFSVRQ